MCLCHCQDDLVVVDVLCEDDFSIWYACTNGCANCTQRAITVALRHDSVEYMDKLLRWTDCNEYIMEVLLVAWVHKRICILTFLFTLFGNIFPAYHIERVFFDYNFTSLIEKEFAIFIANHYDKYMDQLHMCSILVEQSLEDFVDHVRMLSVISDAL